MAIKRIIAIMVVCCAVLFGQAMAEKSASSTIFVYNQGRSKASTDGQDDIRALRLDYGTDANYWHYHFGVKSSDANKSGWNYLGNIPDASKPDYENYGSGCGLYTQAHAIQWLNQQPASDPKRLMEELIGVKGGSSPWDGASDGRYNALITQKTGAECKQMTTLAGNESQVYSILTNGGCISLNIPGHYILAIGATKANLTGSTKTWLHIVDSSCRSTISRLKGDSAYKFDMSGVTGSMNYAGGEYWISFDSCIASNVTPKYAFIPKGNPQPDPGYDTLQFINVYYPSQYKISSAGYWIEGGTIASNCDLQTLTSEIYNANGERVSYYVHQLSGKTVSIKTFDNGASENGLRFSKIKTVGNCKWVLTATDSAGRSLTLEMPFLADYYESTTSATSSKKYEDNRFLDVNGWMDGSESPDLGSFGTVDVYINGNKVADDVNDYYVAHPMGTQYEIKDIKATSGHSYSGVKSGSLSGTMGNTDVRVVLKFDTQSAPTTTYTVCTPFGMNIRSGAGLSNKVLGYARYKSTVEISEIKKVGLITWGYAVSSSNSNVKGWIALTYPLVKKGQQVFLFSETVLVLPKNLTQIDDKAFEGLSVNAFKCPKELESIGNRAFADCLNMKEILIPGLHIQIADDAFEGVPDNMIILGTKGSTAEEYAKKHGFTFMEYTS